MSVVCVCAGWRVVAVWWLVAVCCVCVCVFVRVAVCGDRYAWCVGCVVSGIIIIINLFTLG